MARGGGITLAWPARLVRDDEGRVQVRFPDFPEALTDGADEQEALAEAADCLAEAVAARMADGQEIPPPRPAGRDHRVVLEPVLACKAALYDVMRLHGVGKTELAHRLGIDEKDVRRLLDPRHRSRMDGLQAALAELGVVTGVTVIEVARRERMLSAARSPSPRSTTVQTRRATTVRRAG